MKTLILVLSLLSFDVHARGSKRVSPPPPEPIVLPEPIQGEIVSFYCVSCTDKEKIKLANAQVLANEVIKSECFSNFMQTWGLSWTEGRTPVEVVTHLREKPLTVPVHYYRGKCSVVGYRNVGEPDIYFNRCSHDYYNECDTASNATHEWSHVKNYGHPFKRTSWRGHTVPYAINNAFDSCCGKLGKVRSQGFRNELETRQ